MSVQIHPKFQAFDAEGAPLTGGLVYTYESGTSTAKTTYSDSALSSANTNPVVLDSRGECEIYCQGKLKMVLKTSAGVTVWTMDAIPGTEDKITDADDDTKIQVEESADEDTIRLDTGGTERVTIDSSGNVLCKINDSSIAGNEGLKVKNTNASTGYGACVVMANSAGDEISLYNYTNGVLISKYTTDAWVTPQFLFTVSPSYFTLYQTHTSSDGSITGTMYQWIFQDEDMSDDATVALPTGVQGICMANAYGNSVHAVGMWSVLADGTVLLIAGTQYDDADTDGNLCLYDSGSGATLKQRLGGAAKVRAVFWYY